MLTTLGFRLNDAYAAVASANTDYNVAAAATIAAWSAAMACALGAVACTVEAIAVLTAIAAERIMLNRYVSAEQALARLNKLWKCSKLWY